MIIVVNGDKLFEKKVVEYLEKIKETTTYRDQPVQDDKLRIAYKMFYGIGRTQNFSTFQGYNTLGFFLLK
ncbi:unnamed protein product [Paramecium sonneborni]|uniref:Uncharacterized protein n=1 Tax=Paramecium sonneborni TaxID=65129 RepID=A0A8S1PPK8_9CILI|nr:unnamed protein product [Paramecium sonneborni]